jgi:hypothetical protein
MAAGAGFIEFSTGDILTASAANSYLASQVVMVFADAAARTSAISSPQEGMMSYLKDTNSVEYYSGSAWTAVSGGTSGALTKITAQTFSASSAVNVNSVFSSTYKNYLVLLNLNCSANSIVRVRMRASGSDYTGTGHRGSSIIADNNSTLSYLVADSGNGDTYASILPWFNGGETGVSLTFSNPNTTESTSIFGNGTAVNTSYTRKGAFNAGYAVETGTQYDGFSIFPSSGTITGSVRVYGVTN